VIPFNHPHDALDAGLRDYRAHVENAWDWPPNDGAVSYWYRYALLAAMVVIVAVLAFSLVGCAWNYPPEDGRLHLDAVHPSADRIAQLAQTGGVSVESHPWLRLSSAFVNAGNGVRLSCFVPSTTPHLRGLQLGLLDEVSAVGAAGTHEVNTMERLIESVPCGNYVAVCNALGPAGRVLIHQEQKFTSRGSCNADGGDR